MLNSGSVILTHHARLASNREKMEESLALVALHAGYSHASLALAYLREACREEPFYGAIRCYETLVNKSQQVLLEELVEQRPVLIGFSTYLWNIKETLRLVRLLKQLLPDTLVLLGGPEAGPRAVELLTAHPEIDFIIDGEGEIAFRDLLRWRLTQQGELEVIAGLVWREAVSIRQNPARMLAVDEIPEVLTQNGADFSKPLIYWETSRGCPFKCTFCTSATDRLRTFPMQRIEAELAVLARQKHKVVKLLDRSFHVGKQRTLELLERFAATPEGLRFHLELNPDRISAEAMALFARAQPGKFQFEIGLQTLTEPVLIKIEREMSIPKALDNIRQLVTLARHPVHLDLIVGLPGEDAAHSRRSLDLVFQLHAEHLQLGTLKLLPGTPLREQAPGLGYAWDPEPPYELLTNPLLSFQDLARFKRYAELLERLWNSGYLANTLVRLVDDYYNQRVSDCFDDLLDEIGLGLVRDNLQPDSLFERIARFLQPSLERDQVLRELLLWDYCQFNSLSGKTPEPIARGLEQRITLTICEGRRNLPVLALSTEAMAVINARRLDKLAAGRYAVWHRRHKKGAPVEIIALESNADEAAIVQPALSGQC